MYMQLTVLLSLVSLLMGSAAIAQLWQTNQDHPGWPLHTYFYHFMAFSVLAVTGTICIYIWSNFSLSAEKLNWLLFPFLLSTLPMNLTAVTLIAEEFSGKAIFWLRSYHLVLLMAAALFVAADGWLGLLMLFLVLVTFITIQIFVGLRFNYYPFPKQHWFSPAAFLGLASVVLTAELVLLYNSNIQGGFFSATLALVYALEATRALFIIKAFRQKTQQPWTVELKPDKASSYMLTEREQQIVDGVLKGLSNKQIAYELTLTENTVRNHLARIYRKIGIRKRTELFGKLG